MKPVTKHNMYDVQTIQNIFPNFMSELRRFRSTNDKIDTIDVRNFTINAYIIDTWGDLIYEQQHE